MEICNGSSSTVPWSKWNLEVLFFEEAGKPENPEKKPHLASPCTCCFNLNGQISIHQQIQKLDQQENDQHRLSHFMCTCFTTAEVSRRWCRNITSCIGVIRFRRREKIIIQFPHADTTNKNNATMINIYSSLCPKQLERQCKFMR